MPADFELYKFLEQRVKKEFIHPDVALKPKKERRAITKPRISIKTSSSSVIINCNQAIIKETDGTITVEIIS
jgi:hypothetical protein